jgi:branched-chain amino acid aminotransferase
MLWFEGTIRHETRANLDLADRGLLLGDGVFDTLLAIDGCPVQLDRHVDRLMRACDAIGLGHPAMPVNTAIADLASAHGGHCVIRTTVTRGPGQRGLLPPELPRPTLLLISADWQQAGSFVARNAIISTVRRNAGSPTSRIKSLCCLDNVLALLEASARGADDAIMLSTTGEVACGTTGNLFLHRQGRLITPPLSCGVLEGTVRSWILEAAHQFGFETVEEAILPDDLFKADDLFMTNSVRLISPVKTLDWRPLRSSGRLSVLAEGLSRQIGTIPRFPEIFA